MNAKRNNWFKTLAAVLALVMAGGQGLVTAQESEEEETIGETFELDSFVVQGYAESLRKSIEIKRETVEVTDLIVSEDIGKFPDENVAEALQRLTGVQIQRTNGEGTYVSIRGVEPNLNLVTIDGRTASSGGFERAFDFSTLSADLVSGLRVIKSQSADLIEGGIGAIIEINTPKPLDFREERVGRLTAQTSHLNLTGDYSPKYSGLFSQQFNEGKTGLLFSFSYEDFQQRTDRFGNNGWVRNAIAGGPDLFTPRFFLHQSGLQDRERIGFTGAFQYLPSEDLLITFTANKNEYTTELENNAFNVNTPNRTGAFPDILDDYTFNENGTGIAFDGQTNQAVPIQTYSYRVSDNTGFGVDINWKPNDRWSVDFDASYTSSDTDNNPNNLVNIRFLPSEFPHAVYSFPRGPGSVPDLELTYSPGIDETSPDLYVIRHLQLNRAWTESSESALAVDFDYLLGDGFFSELEFGARLSDRNVGIPNRYGFPQLGIPAADRPTVTNELLTPFPIDNFLAASGANITREWMVVDQARTLAFMAERGYEYDTENWQDYPGNPLQLYDIQEEVLAGYLKLNFSGSLGAMPVSGNLGVRYTDTSLVSSGSESAGGTTQPVSVNRGYDDVLPSFTIVANPHRDVVLRLAGAKVMTRPRLSSMNVRRNANLERVPVSINDGNPYLDPYRADQFDLSFEWYPDESTLLSLAFFYKDVESFVSSVARAVPFTEELLPGANIPLGEEVSLTRPENLAGDTVEGFEVGFQHVFTNLPAPLDGLGVNVNYTYTKSGEGPRNLIFADADLRLEDGTFPDSAFVQLPLEGMSKNSYNLGVFYEKGPFSGRLAYNFRENYLLNSVHHQNTPRLQDDFGQLDGRLAYRINNNFKVTLDALNINEETSYVYYAVDVGAPNPGGKEKFDEFLSTGRKIVLGATYAF
ncbi:MAG: TonB-dependent receptor [Opitutae bacterium]|nr:TonB-dependent receptor [Opitutae bacterium]